MAGADSLKLSARQQTSIARHNKRLRKTTPKLPLSHVRTFPFHDFLTRLRHLAFVPDAQTGFSGLQNSRLAKLELPPARHAVYFER